MTCIAVAVVRGPRATDGQRASRRGNGTADAVRIDQTIGGWVVEREDHACGDRRARAFVILLLYIYFIARVTPAKRSPRNEAGDGQHCRTINNKRTYAERNIPHGMACSSRYWAAVRCII